MTPTTRETADHAELTRLRQHIANLKLRPGHHVQFGTPSVSQISNYWNRDLAADLEALLTEIAALRGERDGLMATRRWNVIEAGPDLHVCDGDHEKSDRCDYQIFVPLDRLTQAERQRDEARDTIASAVAKADWMQGRLSGDRSSIDRETIELVVSECRAYCHLQVLANQGADR